MFDRYASTVAVEEIAAFATTHTARLQAFLETLILELPEAGISQQMPRM